MAAAANNATSDRIVSAHELVVIMERCISRGIHQTEPSIVPTRSPIFSGQRRNAAPAMKQRNDKINSVTAAAGSADAPISHMSCVPRAGAKRRFRRREAVWRSYSRRGGGMRRDLIGANSPAVKEREGFGPGTASEPPRGGNPRSLRVAELADLDDLVFRAQREPAEHGDADSAAVDEIVAAVVEQLAAVRRDLEIVEEPARLAEELDRTERQRADDRRRDAFRVRLDGQELERRRRIAEVDVIELHREDAIEPPAGEEALRVAVLVETDVDVADALELGREIAEAGTEIKPGVLVRGGGADEAQRARERDPLPFAMHEWLLARKEISGWAWRYLSGPAGRPAVRLREARREHVPVGSPAAIHGGRRPREDAQRAAPAGGADSIPARSPAGRGRGKLYASAAAALARATGAASTSSGSAPPRTMCSARRDAAAFHDCPAIPRVSDVRPCSHSANDQPSSAQARASAMRSAAAASRYPARASAAM